METLVDVTNTELPSDDEQTPPTNQSADANTNESQPVNGAPKDKPSPNGMLIEMQNLMSVVAYELVNKKQ